MIKPENNTLIKSYLTQRRFIGALGIGLPFICMAGAGFHESISGYYHTSMRDVFVGLMVCLSVFLLTYRGYEMVDRIVCGLTAVAGLGVAFLPCIDYHAVPVPTGVFHLDPRLADTLHTVCAVLFLALLAANSLFLFTRSVNNDKTQRTREKISRNMVYRVCGIAILVLLAGLGIVMVTVDRNVVNASGIILILETLMLVFFGFSWLVKGETLWKDKT